MPRLLRAVSVSDLKRSHRIGPTLRYPFTDGGLLSTYAVILALLAAVGDFVSSFLSYFSVNHH